MKVFANLPLIMLLFFTLWGTAQSTKNPLKTKADSILYHLKNPSSNHILAVSHRGDWRYAPENSIQAIKRCIDLGVDVVELDFRLTKDGHLVAMHDETVDRTTNGTGRVENLTLEEIKTFRLKNACGARHSRQQVPTLEEVMTLVKGKIMVNLDKTESRWVKEAYEVLQNTGTVDHAIFKGNDEYAVMRKKYGSLMDSIIYMPKLWSDKSNIRSYRAKYEKSIDPFYYETLFDTVDAETFKMVADLKKDGDGFLAIALWDDLCAGRTDELALLEGPDSAWGWLIENGATGIMTDRPEELIDYLIQKGLRKDVTP
jgi:glycerophosphoryl diester phosphodiesterase